MKRLFESLSDVEVDFIFYDLEFCKKYCRSGMKFEIIQIGAVKTDIHLNEIDRFEMLIRPCVSRLDKYCSQVTGLTIEDLQFAEGFSQVLEKFDEFVGSRDHIFFMWGSNDYRVLKAQVDRYRTRVSNISLKPGSHIDLQRLIVPCSFDALSLENALNMYGEELSALSEHDALSDAVGLKTLLGKYMEDRGVINRYYAQFTPAKVVSITNKVKKILEHNRRIISPESRAELIDQMDRLNIMSREGYFSTEEGVEELDEIDKKIKKIIASCEPCLNIIKRGHHGRGRGGKV